MKKILIVLALFIVSFSNAFSKDLIVNFSRVNEDIYRGARLTSVEAVQYLKSIGVKNIINLQGGDLESSLGKIIPWAEPGERAEVIAQEKSSTLAAGMGFYHNPLNSLDPITNDENKAIDETLEFMHDKTNQPVFIHCEHGADRTGLLVALYRVKYEKMDVEAARREWIRNGHNKIHQIFTGDLDDYYYEKVKEFKK